MKKIATMTLAALLSVLSPGCGSKGSTQVSLPHPTNTPSPTTPTVPTPTATPATPTSQIFADLIDATDDGSYAVVRDIRVPTYGQLISINTATGQDHTIQVNPTSCSRHSCPYIRPINIHQHRNRTRPYYSSEPNFHKPR